MKWPRAWRLGLVGVLAPMLAAWGTCAGLGSGTRADSNATDAKAHSASPGDLHPAHPHGAMDSALPHSAKSANSAMSSSPSPAETAEQSIEQARSHGHGALLQAAGAAGGWWAPLAEQPPLKELLSERRALEGSQSIGTTRHGRLLRARALPFEGPHHLMLPKHRGRNTHYGTAELVTLIEEVAREVASRHPGTRLQVGNLGRSGGGRIRWSNSHQAGRDVDLAFFATDRAGRDVPAEDFLTFNARGEARRQAGLYFDPARNWTVVRALLTHPGVNVQWIFVSNGLRNLLLAHGRSLGEPEDLLARAALVMRQPVDALAHDDHFHVRIGCSARDRLEGCLDLAPRWPWLDWHEQALRARALRLGEGLEPGADAVPTWNSATALRALEMLARLQAAPAADVALTRGLAHPDAAVRERAVDVALDAPAWGPAAVQASRALVGLAASGPPAVAMDSERTERLFARLADSGHSLAGQIALELLERPDTVEALREQAAALVARFPQAPVVGRVIALLEQQPPGARARLVTALQMATNQPALAVHSSSGEPGAQAEGEVVVAPPGGWQSAQWWRNWWAVHGTKPRATWVAEGLSALAGGSRQTWEEPGAVDELIALLAQAPAHVAHNIDAILARLTGVPPAAQGRTPPELHRRWSRWRSREQAAQQEAAMALDDLDGALPPLVIVDGE